MEQSTQLATPPVASAPRRRRQIGDSAIQRMFIIPTLTILIVWNIFPLFYSLYLSFTRYSHSGKIAPIWVGLSNFTSALSDPKIWLAFAVTGRFALASVALQMLIGFGMALLLHGKFKANGLLTTLILVPMMLSPVVVGQFWELILDPLMGIFNYLIGYWSPVGAPDWLATRALAGAVIVDVWMWSPFVMLLSLSGLKAIPDYIYEAAAIDRASAWRQFWRITLPQVAPLLLIAVLFRTIEALKAFDMIMGLTGGGPGNQTETVSISLYRMVFVGQARTGEAGALAYIVLIIIVGISNVYVRYLNRMKEA